MLLLNPGQSEISETSSKLFYQSVPSCLNNKSNLFIKKPKEIDKGCQRYLLLSKANINSQSKKSLKKTISKFSELTEGCRKKMSPRRKFLKFCLANSSVSDYHTYKVKQQLCTRNTRKVNLNL